MNAEDRLEHLVRRHEGLRLKPYLCPAQKLTIGVGRNLEDAGITEEEALYLLRNDLGRTLAALESGRWDDASREMLDSRWARQTPGRAEELAQMVRAGEWPRAERV